MKPAEILSCGRYWIDFAFLSFSFYNPEVAAEYSMHEIGLGKWSFTSLCHKNKSLFLMGTAGQRR